MDVRLQEAGIDRRMRVVAVVAVHRRRIDADMGLLEGLAVDRVADMARTAVNVWSDAVGAAVISKMAKRGPWGGARLE